ncbi:MAG: hypothetical protein HYZ16_10305 [Bacteroidetes bacterium]|nr:hypothetical protein [Bacteroidota bacterium]
MNTPLAALATTFVSFLRLTYPFNMWHKILAFLLILSIVATQFSGAHAHDLLPKGQRIISYQVNNKLVIELSSINTDGLRLQLFSESGDMVESVLLRAGTASHQMEKPTAGVYLLFLKKESAVAIKRLRVN